MRRLISEPLEPRQMLAAPQLASNHDAIDVDVEVLAPLHVALNGTDADGDAITYSVVSITTDNGTIINVADYLTATISDQANRSLVLNIEQRDADTDDLLHTFDPLILQLFEDIVPETTQHFIDLIEAGEFDGDPIHRIVPNFVIQNLGTAPSATTFDDQFSPLLQHTSAGILSLSKPSQDDMGAASFFITDGDTQFLDYNHPVFGFLTSGEEVRDAINSLPTTSDAPNDPVFITDAEIIHDDQNGIVRLSGLQEVVSGSNSFQVTIRAVDANGDFDPNEDLTITIDVVAPFSQENRPYLNPIADIHTTAETPVDVQLTATDIDGGDIQFGLEAFPPGYAPSGSALTGLLTLTPEPGYAGTIMVWPSVQQSPPHSQSPKDTQLVPLMITPATPIVEVLNFRGGQETHDNSSGNEVPFRLSNLSHNSGTNGTTTVTIYAQRVNGSASVGAPILIYEGEATAETMNVVSDGLTPLTNGQTYHFVAQQTWEGTINFGNRAGEAVTLTGETSQTRNVIIQVGSPQFLSEPVTLAVLGEGTYSYNVDSTAEGSTNIYTLLADSATGLAINAATGEITGTPTGVGVFSIGIIIQDGSPSATTTNIQEFVLTVADRPVLVIEDQMIDEGDLLSLDLNAFLTDLDFGDTHTFAITDDGGSGALLVGFDVPAGITDEGVFQWTPTESHGGLGFTFEVTVTDSFGLDNTETFTVTVNKTNQDPTINGIRDQIFLASGATLNFTVNGKDADLPEQSLTYSLMQPVGLGATINPTTGAFEFVSDASHSGMSFDFIAKVSDGNGGMAEEPFSIFVDLNVNPTILDIGDREVNEGSLLEINLDFFYSDGNAGDVITFTIDNVPMPPDGASILPGTNIFSWTPSESQGAPEGTEHVISITADDGNGGTATTSFTVTVNEVNVAPTLDPIPDFAVAVGEPVAFTATADDVDLPVQTQTFSLNGDAPAGATINPTTGAFSWTPGAAFDVTDTTFTVTVSDGDGGMASQSFTVYVNKNVAPKFAQIPDMTIDEGVLFQRDLNDFLSDLNAGDSHTFSLINSNLPVGVTIGETTGVLSWTPTEDQGTTPGTAYPITVMVDDGNGETATASFALTVEEANNDPTIDPIADMVVGRDATFTFTATASDTDLPANMLTFSLSGEPSGMTIDSSTGEISWTTAVDEPAAIHSITVHVDDGEGGMASDTFDLRVSAAPILNIPDTDANEAVELSLDLMTHVTDENLPSDTHTFAIVGADNGATLSPEGLFSFTPDESQGGTVVTFTVRVTDQDGLTADSTFDVTVNETNVDPVLDPINDKSVEVDNILDFTVSASDGDIPVDTLVYSLTGTVPDGASIDAATGQFTWTPVLAQDATAYEFTVMVDDQNGGTDSQTFMVYVGLNAPPEFTEIPDMMVDEGTLISLNLNDYVFDADSGDTHTFALLNDPAIDGVVLDEASGILTWTPSEAQGLPGGQVFVFSVSVSDGVASPVVGEFNITVNDVNADPTIDPIADMFVGRDEMFTLSVSASDTDTPGDTLAYSLSGDVPTGMTIDPATGEITWTTAADEAVTTYAISVDVSDGAGGMASEAFNLTVNTAPVLSVPDQDANEGVELPLDLTIFLTDEGLPSDTHTFVFVGANNGATLSEAGMFAFTPDMSQAGMNVSFTIRVTDQGGLSVEDTFEVTVNGAPELSIPDMHTNVGVELPLDLTTYLTDVNLPGDTHTFEFVGPNNGASLSEAGMFAFTPDMSQGAMDVSFTVIVTDEHGLTAEDTFVVTVNVAPVLTIPDTDVDETVELSLDLTSFVSDANLGDTHTFELVGAPNGATLTPAGMFSFTPDDSQGGDVVTFTVLVTDQGGLTSEDTFDVTVNDTNADPVLDLINDMHGDVDILIDFTVSATDSDIPADTLVYSLTGTVPDGALIDAATGQFTWTPVLAQDGAAYPITVMVDDQNGGTASQEFTVFVGINAPPEFRGLPDRTVDEGTLISFNLNDFVFDADVDDTMFTFTHTNGIAGVVVDESSGLFTWTPSETQGQSGGQVFVIGVTVNDGNGAPVQGEFRVTVNEVNEDPTIDPIADRFVGRDEMFTLGVVASDSDIDEPTQTLSYSLSGDVPTGMEIDSMGEITWTTAADEAPMTYAITVNVVDGAGGMAQEAFNLTVNPGPALDIPDMDVDETIALPLDLTMYLTDDSPTDSHTFELTAAGHLGATLSSDGMFSFTPGEADGGSSFSFTVRVTDQGGKTAESTFEVTVNDTNTPPDVMPISDALVNEGDMFNVQVIATDTDLPADTLVYSLVTFPTGMTINSATGEIEWDTTGADADDHLVEVSVSDGTEEDTVMISFTVTVNVAPVLDIADTSVDENLPLSIDLMAFVTDGNLPDNDMIGFTLTDAGGTSATVSPGGMFNWTPGEEDGGLMFMFTVEVIDRGGLTDTSTFTVTVNDTNEDPMIAPIDDDSINPGETFTYQVIAGDTDLPADTLVFGLLGNVPTGMTISATGEITWDTASDELPMSYEMQVKVDDGAGGSATESFILTVNAAPMLDVPDQTIDEEVPFVLDISQFMTDPNMGNDHHFYEIIAGGSLTPTLTSDGMFRWTPTEMDGGGSYSFSVRVVDQGGLMAMSSFLIIVNEVNVDPMLDPISDEMVNVGDMVSITAMATDSDLPANTLTFGLATFPTGMTIGSASGLIEWDTTGATAGVHDVEVTVDDGQGGSATQSFTVTVNVAPVLDVADTSVVENTLLSYDLKNFLSDGNLPGDTHTFELVDGPAGLTISAAGILNWTPSEDQGPESYMVTVRVTDQLGLTAESTFMITVDETNTDPVIAPIDDEDINQGDMLSVDVDASDVDVPDNTLVFSLTTFPTGMTIDASTGVISWDSTGAAAGDHAVEVMVSDGEGGTDVASFTVNVNVAPTLDIDDQTVNETELLSIDLNDFVDDENDDDDSHKFLLTDAPVAGVSIDNNGVLTWTPNAAQGPGTYVFAVQVTDKGGLTATNTFEVTVVEPNVAPVLSIPSVSQRTVTQPNEVNILLEATDGNADDTLRYELVSGPDGATVDPVMGKLWMSTQSDSAVGDHVFTVRVTDDGEPAMSDEITFTVTVLPKNSSSNNDSSAPQSVSAFESLGFLNEAVRSEGSAESDGPAAVVNSSPAFDPSAGSAGDASDGGDDGLPAGAPNFSEGPDTGVEFAPEGEGEDREGNEQASNQGDDEQEVRGQDPDGDDSGAQIDSEQPPLGHSTNPAASELLAGSAAQPQDAALESFDDLALEWAADSAWTAPIVTDGSEIDLWWATGEGRLAGPVDHTPAGSSPDETTETGTNSVANDSSMQLAALASAAYFAGPMLVTDLGQLRRRPASWVRRLRRVFGS